MSPTESRARSRVAWHRRSVTGPALITALAGVLLAITGVRGSDYPAHYFRADEWRANPFGTWNFQWYGGHSTFTYSVLSPPLSAVVSVFGLCVIASLAAVVLAGLLARRLVDPAAAAAATFTVALVAIDSIVVGRAPFALGYALLVAVLLSWSHGRVATAAGLAVAVGLASPVAAVMLGLIVAPIAIDQGLAQPGPLAARWHATRTALVIGAATALPLVVMALVTARSPSPAGYFPFIAVNIVFSVVVAATITLAARRRVVRMGATIALAVTVVAAVVPNPLGGNLSRYTAFVLLPIATALAVDWYQHDRTTHRPVARRRSGAIAMVATSWLVAVGFAVSFSARTTYRWYHDPSHDASYFDPVLDEIARWQRDRPLTRVEIPFTQGHMEAAVVAGSVPYARGWERQIDLARNAVLYDSELSAHEYRAWLDSMGVGLVAVPDAPLDAGGKPETRLVDAGLDWLTPVWEGEHWRLYAVDQPQPLAINGVVTAIDATGITFDADHAGDVVIAATYDPRLGVTPGGCLRADPFGNIVVTVTEPGEYHIGERPGALLTGSRATCSRDD